jgi:hypothetical protein
MEGLLQNFAERLSLIFYFFRPTSVGILGPWYSEQCTFENKCIGAMNNTVETTEFLNEVLYGVCGF